MMEPTEYVFQIDAFTPDTLPMGKLAEYLKLLADVVGSKAEVHFTRIEKGSARLIHKVEVAAAAKVATRIKQIDMAQAPLDAQKAFKALDDLLAEDNATAKLASVSGAVVLPFPGRNRPKTLSFPALRQDGTIEGQVVSIGGRDSTAHVILQSHGITYSGCTLKRELARQLATYLYGPVIQLVGSGRWERHRDGSWRLLEFRVDRFEVLDESPLSTLLDDIRALPENDLMSNDDTYHQVLDLRIGDGEVH